MSFALYTFCSQSFIGRYLRNILNTGNDVIHDINQTVEFRPGPVFSDKTGIGIVLSHTLLPGVVSKQITSEIVRTRSKTTAPGTVITILFLDFIG